MKQTIQLTVVALLAGLLVACATATPYQSMQRGEGYSDQKLESNRYRIRFAGNRLTDKDTVQNYLLFRAAELTLDNGHDYFVTVNLETDSETTQQQSFSLGAGFGHWYWHPFGGVGVTTTTASTEYVAEAHIMTFKGEKPDSDLNAFDAREVVHNLQSKIIRPDK